MCISDVHKQKKKKKPKPTTFVAVGFDPLCFTSLFVGFITGMLRIWPLGGYKGLIYGFPKCNEKVYVLEMCFYS